MDLHTLGSKQSLDASPSAAFFINQENGNHSTVNHHEIRPEPTVEDWLPITSARNGKWYYSAIHNVTAIVGAGVLSLPFAMAQLGWGAGVTVLILSWLVTLYTLWQMVEMHEMVPGKRFNRYYELGQHAFGEKWGLWIVVPQQLIVEVGVDIVYMITGGQSLRNFHDNVSKNCDKLGLSVWILIFASCHFVLAQLRNYKATAGLSLAAAVMCVSYSTIAWVDSLSYLHHDPACKDNNLPSNGDHVARVMAVFSALGQVAFAYAGHNVVLEIQAMMPSTPEKPSKVPMWRGVLVAYIIVALCYFPVSLVGYKRFGKRVRDNILSSLHHPPWLIALANMMVVIHVIGSYQIYAMPVFDMLETFLVKKLHLRPGILLRLIARSAYVAFTCFMAIALPHFHELLGFFGGFALAPTTYFLPCIMWLRICKPIPFSPSWITNWVCILLGVLLMILSSIGGMAQIITDHKFFSSSFSK